MDPPRGRSAVPTGGPPVGSSWGREGPGLSPGEQDDMHTDTPTSGAGGLRDPRRAELDRRALLRRGAVLGGAVAWSTPMVQSLASPAFAAGSPLCRTRVETEDCTLVYEESPDCCACVEQHPELSLADALDLCAQQGACLQTLELCGDQDREPPPGPDGDGGSDYDVDVPTVFPAGS